MAINYTRRKDVIDKSTTIEFANSADMVLPGMDTNEARPREIDQEKKTEVPGEVMGPLPDIPAVDPKEPLNYRFWTPRRIAIAIIICIGVLITCILVD